MQGNPVGETIAGRYELLEVIGRGGQGVVCRARDSETGHDVAVKVIESHAARAPETVERMAREQQAMLALSGTNAVQFLDMCSAEDGALCLVMELLEGQEFESYLVGIENAGSLISVDELVTILDPIVTTLDRAHSVGIVHRDLKPGNIFLLSERCGGGSRLLDFGFARLSDSKRVTNTGMVMGSPSYIAPEMWKGRGKTADHRVDVYSFGVIVFRALAGGLPFPNSSMQETLIAVTRAARPSLAARRDGLPAAVDGWVSRALAIEPDDRFFSVRASWDYLLWALGLAKEPDRVRTGWTNPPPDADKIRQFLEEPVSERAAPAQSIWSMAATALKRLVGRSAPAPQPIRTSPPPLPVERKKSERAAPLPKPAPGEIAHQKAKLPGPLPRPVRVVPKRVERVAAHADLPEVSAELIVDGVAEGMAAHDLPEVSAELIVERASDHADLPEVSAQLIVEESVVKELPLGVNAPTGRPAAKHSRQHQKSNKPRGTKRRTKANDGEAKRANAAAKPGTPGHVKPPGVGKPKWKSRRHRKKRR